MEQLVRHVGEQLTELRIGHQLGLLFRNFSVSIDAPAVIVGPGAEIIYEQPKSSSPAITALTANFLFHDVSHIQLTSEWLQLGFEGSWMIIIHSHPGFEAFELMSELYGTFTSLPGGGFA